MIRPTFTEVPATVTVTFFVLYPTAEMVNTYVPFGNANEKYPWLPVFVDFTVPPTTVDTSAPAIGSKLWFTTRP